MKKTELDGHETPEIEIFRAGNYPQGTFTHADLDQIAARYDPKLHEAPAKLDHDAGPAYGWVKGLRRAGDSLMAKFHQLAPGFIEMIREGRYKARSAEIWTNFQGGPYLKAVAWLGAAIPQVKGLAPATFADGGESITVIFEEDKRMGNEKVQDPPAIKTFTEAEHQAIVEAERKRAADEATSKFAEAQAAAEKERKRAEELEVQVRKMAADAVGAEIHRFCEGLKTEGKLLPAWQEQGIERFMLALDSTSAVKFSETSSSTPLAWFQQFLSGLPKLVPLGESKTAGAVKKELQFSEDEDRVRRELGLSKEDFEKYSDHKEK